MCLLLLVLLHGLFLVLLTFFADSFSSLFLLCWALILKHCLVCYRLMLHCLSENEANNSQYNLCFNHIVISLLPTTTGWCWAVDYDFNSLQISVSDSLPTTG